MCLQCMWKRLSDPMRLIPIVRRYVRSESYLVHLLSSHDRFRTVGSLPYLLGHLATCASASFSGTFASPSDPSPWNPLKEGKLLTLRFLTIKNLYY